MVNEAEYFLFVSDVPGVPTNLQATNVTQDTATLTWHKPRHDGGAKIRNYIIERRDTTRHTWSHLAVVDAHKTSYLATGLRDGSDYYFRVFAENDMGVGEACEMLRPITTQPEMGMYTGITDPSYGILIKSSLNLFSGIITDYTHKGDW